MLYDPKWDAKVKPDISLRGLLAWLADKDPSTIYDYTIAETCLITRFMKDVFPGRAVSHNCGSSSSYSIDGEIIDTYILQRVACDAASQNRTPDDPHYIATYADAAHVARQRLGWME